MAASDVVKEREEIVFDVVIVGGGPAGLACAIRLKQLAVSSGTSLSICVVEKAAELGAHTLSGAVIDLRAIDELLPTWTDDATAPLHTRVSEDHFFWLSKKHAYRVPALFLPKCLKNKGNSVVSLGRVTRWLGQHAQMLGVEICTGFAAAEVLYGPDGSVRGVITGDMGVGRDGRPTARFQPGVVLKGRYTLFAEGSRGHLGRSLMARFALNASSDLQSYAIGFKELWSVEAAFANRLGRVWHTVGWPLGAQTYGGGFLYHVAETKVSIGYVVGLNYKNPYIDPFQEFQRYKTHPMIRSVLEKGRCLGYGARTITAGGLSALPKLIFPGGGLIGCEAGFLNPSRIKGTHAAMKSGMLAAEAVYSALQKGRSWDMLEDYPKSFQDSWLYDELYRARNFKPAMNFGLWKGAVLVGLDQHVFRGKAPFTLHNRQSDEALLLPAQQAMKIRYPAPDGVLTFSRERTLALSGTAHEVDQPVHLILRDPDMPVVTNLLRFAGPEARYCPAGVYEFTKDSMGNDQLQIHAQNCLHCKTCDIKDPQQNISWVPPEGGGGPSYSEM